LPFGHHLALHDVCTIWKSCATVSNEQSVSEPLIESSMYQAPAATISPAFAPLERLAPAHHVAVVLDRVLHAQPLELEEVAIGAGGRMAFVGTSRSVSARMSCSPSENSTRSVNG
jgi:hypothetical protein